MNELKQYLFDKYKGFSDKRIKNLDKSSIFIVDDRGKRDFNAKNELFYWFCMIFADVIDNDNVKVQFSCKTNLIETANIQNDVIITPKNIDTLEIMASNIENIIKKEYSVSSFKYVCPRTATSLRKLKKNLELFWNK